MYCALLDQQNLNGDCGIWDICVVTCLQAEEIRGLKMQLESYHQLQAKPHRATQRSVEELRLLPHDCKFGSGSNSPTHASLICSIRELEQQVQELDYALQSRNPSANPT